MSRILFTILICIPLLTFSQKRLDKELDSITTETEAAKFIENNKKVKGKIIVFNKEKHNTNLTKDLFKLSTGGQKIYKSDSEKTYYKVIEKRSIPYYRMSYIYLDGSQKSTKEIHTERLKILQRYKDGAQFKDLAKLHSMDQNAKRGGDLGWFTKGDLHPDFEVKVLDETIEVNDIFTVDIPKQKWYYVVKKTHETKLIDEIKVLKVSEPL